MSTNLFRGFLWVRLFAVAIVVASSVPTPAWATTFLEATQGRLVFDGTAKIFSSDGSAQTITGRLGQGAFTYSATPVERTYVGPSVIPTYTPAEVIVTRAMNLRLIESLQVAILGFDFTDSFLSGGSGQFEVSQDYFWRVPVDAGNSYPDSTETEPAMVTVHSISGDAKLYEDSWRLGSTRDSQIAMFNGKWELNGFNRQGAIFATGTWQAEAVPEPLTIAGTLLAIGFGVAFRLAKRGVQQDH